MRKKRASSFSVIGGSSLLTVFAVVCLTVFAMLSLTTVQAQKRLSDSSIQSVERYYTADLEAERIFTQLRNGETVPGVVESEGIYAYRCPISDSQTLYVELATVLKTVVSQQLLPDCSGGMVPACEILHLNNAVRSMIRDNKNHQIGNAISSGAKDGMVSMDQAILQLYRAGSITQETALLYCDKP